MRGARQLLSLVAAAGYLAGCGPSTTGSLVAPRMTGAVLEGFDSILVTFTPPAGAESVEVEARLDAGEWGSLGSGPGDSTQLFLNLQPAAPEAADFGFRVRATRGGKTSAWSAIATVHRGVRPAANLTIMASPGQAPLLYWARGSTQADTLRLDRRLFGPDGTMGAWSALASLPLDATSYADADRSGWLDGASFDYRLVYLKGAAESDPALVSGPQAPPLAPVGLRCNPAGEGAIQLDWTPRSHYATRQVVVRTSRAGPGTVEVATLAADASTFLDTVPMSGQYVYFVSARVGAWTNDVADGAPVLGATAIPALSFAPFAMAFPAGDQVVRRANGRFATVTTASGYPVNAVRIWEETSSGWVSRDAVLAGYPELAEQALLAGPGDRIDLIYGQMNGGAWHDWSGGSWSTEPLAAGLPSGAVEDAAGALHLVTCVPGWVDYSTNAGGAWVTERLPASTYADRCAIATGPDGALRVAYTSPQPVPPGQGGSADRSDLYLLTRSAGGWSEAQVPLGAEATQRYATLLRLFTPSAEEVVIIYARPSAVGDVSVGAIERGAAGWGQVQSLGLRPFDGRVERFAAAASPVGARVALAWNGSPTTLLVRTAPGAWTSTPLEPNGGYGVALGFSPAGKLWLIDGLGWSLGGILYEER